MLLKARVRVVFEDLSKTKRLLKIYYTSVQIQLDIIKSIEFSVRTQWKIQYVFHISDIFKNMYIKEPTSF